MKRIFILGTVVFYLVFAFLFAHSEVAAAEKTFQREYNYQASEADSKLTSRAMALEQVKRLLLEELGTYLESRTEVKNLQLEHDKVLALTAGVVRTVIVEEKWDGRTYYLKARISADPEQVARNIRELQKDAVKSKELVKQKSMEDNALKQAEDLKKEVVATGDIKKQKKYKGALAGWIYGKANEEFDKGKYREAEDLYTRSLEIDPESEDAYYNRGLARKLQNKYKQALDDYNHAIKVNPRFALAYVGKGVINTSQGSYYLAIDNFTKALELDPGMTDAYYNRGNAYLKLENYVQAIREYDKVIEIAPSRDDAYGNRALAYSKLGNISRAVEDWKISARMGNANSQYSLRRRGISW